MQTLRNRKTDVICAFFLYAAPAAGVWAYGLTCSGDTISIFSALVIALILATAFFTFLRVNENSFYHKINYPVLYFGSFFLSFVLLGARAGLYLGIFWMLAVVVAALDSGIELAVATHIVLMVQYVSLIFPQNSRGYYSLVAYILLGIVLTVLFSQLKDTAAVPYLTLILFASDGVLQCVIYQFNLAEMRRHFFEIVMELVSISVFVVFGYVYIRWLGTSCVSSGEDVSVEDDMQELPVEPKGAVPESGSLSVNSDLPENGSLSVNSDLPENSNLSVNEALPENGNLSVNNVLSEHSGLSVEEAVQEDRLPVKDAVSEDESLLNHAVQKDDGIPVDDMLHQNNRVPEDGRYVDEVKRDHSIFAENTEDTGHTLFEENAENTGHTLFEENMASLDSRVPAEGLFDEGAHESSDGTTAEEELLIKFTEPDFELLRRLALYSGDLYEHSEKIGNLAQRAVQEVSGNPLLAKAGGLYHEIGRIEDEKDYINAGDRLGKSYGFPASLLNIMRQHSTGFELPQSVEAAVVMLCDCIISTSDYLVKSGMREKISDERLISNIFQNRLDKGNLDHSGMTEEQIETLKEFYIQNTFE